MTKSETLQKYLTCFTSYGDLELCKDCPYNPHPGKIWEFGCAHGQDRMTEDAIKFLKEQEAVEPVSLSNRRYACGNCGNSLWVSGQRFCASCGRKVKWDE